MSFFVKNGVELLESEINAADSTSLGGTIGYLPKGATVLAAGVEVVTNFDANVELSLGYSSDTDALVSPTAITAKSLVMTTLNKREEVVVAFDQTTVAGTAIVRILYALPTKVERDF